MHFYDEAYQRTDENRGRKLLHFNLNESISLIKYVLLFLIVLLKSLDP